MPRLWTEAKPATTFPSHIPNGIGEAKESFSAVFEQTAFRRTAGESQSNANSSSRQVPVQGNSSSVDGAEKREAKPSDSKTSSAVGRCNSVTRTGASTPDSQAETLATAAVQTTPALALNWKLATPDPTSDDGMNAVAVGDEGAFSFDAALDSTVVDSTVEAKPPAGSTSTPSLVKDTEPSEGQADACLQESANKQQAAAARLDQGQFGVPMGTSSCHSAGADSRGEEPSPSSLSSSLSLHAPVGTDGFISPKTQPSSGTTPLRDVSHICNGTTDESNRTAAVTKADDDPVALSLSVVPTALSLAMSIPAGANSCDSQATVVEAKLDSSTVNGTSGTQGSASQEPIRTGIEAYGGTKVQYRKDDSFSTANSQSVDQSAGSAPAKGAETVSPFSLVGTQPAPTMGDGKSARARSSAGASDGQPAGYDQESTGLEQGETAIGGAYPASLINSAKLIERIGEAELRLGVRAGEFGSVDIRTSMIRNQLTAEISVERGELGRVMAAELPGLQDRLADQRLGVANVTLQNHGGSHSTGSGQQKAQDGQKGDATNSVSGPNEAVLPVLVASEGTAQSSRLDIHM